MSQRKSVVTVFLILLAGARIAEANQTTITLTAEVSGSLGSGFRSARSTIFSSTAFAN